MKEKSVIAAIAKNVNLVFIIFLFLLMFLILSSYSLIGPIVPPTAGLISSLVQEENATEQTTNTKRM